MDKTPFSVYDFLAYLSSGAALVVATDYLSGSGVVLKPQGISLNVGILLIFAAYVLGQITASISSWLYETILVRRLLGSPLGNLLEHHHAPRIGRALFPGYYRSLPKVTRSKIAAKASSLGCEGGGEGLFLHCYAAATANVTNLQSRLDDFRNQYGFARNVSCALMLVALAIAITWRHDPARIHIRWALAAAFGSVGLLYRYLKFYRQYSYELLLRYSELKISE